MSTDRGTDKEAVVCYCPGSGLTLCDPMDCSPPGSFVLGDSPGKNTGVGCHALLQGKMWGIHTHTHTHTHINTYTYMCVYTHIHMYIPTYVCIHTHREWNVTQKNETKPFAVTWMDREYHTEWSKLDREGEISCAAAAAKSIQSCPTLCDPIDGSPPGSSVLGILQARILGWVAISFSNACMHAKLLQLCRLCATPWTAAHQAPRFTGFSRQEYCRGLPFSSPIKKPEHQGIDAFELWCWRRLLRVPWTARRSSQLILRQTSPEYLLEGLMLKLKLQYFGHLMLRTDSLEKTLMLEKI